jgi:hypothetical protein
MTVTEPDAQGVDHQAPENLLFQLLHWALGQVTFVLIILTIGSIFLFSVAADWILLQVLDWAFGSTVKQNAVAENILALINTISGWGSIAAFLMTLGFIFGQLERERLKQSSKESEEKPLESFTSLWPKWKKLFFWLVKPKGPMLTVIAVTFKFLSAIILVVALLWLLHFLLKPDVIAVPKAMAALVIAAAYVVDLAFSLFGFIRDLLTLLRIFSTTPEAEK